MFGSAASMIGIQFCIQHPFSRGYIHINSTSVFDYPEINPNYLSISYDLDVMRAALQYVRRIIATSPMSGMISSETSPGASKSADTDINSYIESSSVTDTTRSGHTRCFRWSTAPWLIRVWWFMGQRTCVLWTC